MIADLILWPTVALGDALACLLHPVPASRMLIKYLVGVLLLASLAMGAAAIFVASLIWSMEAFVICLAVAYLLMIAAGAIGRTLLRY